MYFLKRKPEPHTMDALEHKTFGEFSLENYKRWFIPLVDDILERTKLKKGLILDIASGPGLLTKEIASRSDFFKVIGIDISKDTIKIAKHNTKSSPNSSIVLGSVYKLPFPKNHFDLVVCKDSFHHFDKPEKALTEIWRVLRPGGYVYIQDLKRDVPMYLLRRSIPRQTVMQKLQYYSVRAAYTKDEIKKILLKVNPKKFTIQTRKLSKQTALKYKKLGINPNSLRESFQSRYVLFAGK